MSRTPSQPRVAALTLPAEPPEAPPEPSFSLLVESVRDYAIIMLDPGGHVATWNRGAERIKGYPAAEVIGKHFSMFYPAEDVESGKWQRELQTATDDGRYEEEVWRVRKDGTRFWANVVVTAMRDGTGALVGFAKITRDLTERRLRDEALSRGEERFRILVDGVKDYAIFSLDADGRVETWNSGAQRIKGYTADEIIGQHFSKFYPAEDLAAGKTEMELEVATRDGRFEEEAWRVRKDGTKFWASVVLTALRDSAGTLTGFAKVTRDLTQRRKLELERLKLAQTEESVRLRDEFLSIASHELRTPLSSLLLQLESVRSRLDESDPALAKKVERASRSGERLAELVETLLDVSRIATGRLDLELTTLDLDQVARDVVDSMVDDAAAARCVVSLVPSAAPAIGRWDRLRLEQVIGNLLANAFRYAAGTAVEVSILRDAGHAEVRVRDHGPGIKEAELPRIFERFARGASMKHYGGMGLGLYVVEQIASAHGGTCGATNAPDGGAIVFVRLPIEAAAAGATTRGDAP